MPAVNHLLDPNTCTVADLVRIDYRTAEVFRQYGIDFCCGGKKPVSQAVVEKGLDPAQVWNHIESSISAPAKGSDADISSWPVSLMCHYIVDIHHAYIRRTMPSLLQFSAKVARVHGPSDPRLVELGRVIEEMDAALADHLATEEEVLFPAIRSSHGADEGGLDLIDQMESEHDTVGALMAEARKLTDGFTPPDWACNTYRVLFATLEDFERDLHRHVFLENHVLFPKWIEHLAS